MVVWSSGFLEARGTKAKKPDVFRKRLFFGLAAEGGKAEKPVFPLNSVVFGPWYPRRPKTHLAPKTLRDSSDRW